MASWFLSGLEGLDDDHGSAAVWAGLGEGRRFGVIGAVGVVGLGGRHGEQFAGTGDVAGAAAVGEQTVVADAVEALGQDVDKKASDELRYRQGHGLISLAFPIGIWGPVVLPLEGHAAVVEGDETAVGNRDPVGITRQVGEHGLGPTERRLGVDHPFDLAQRREIGR